MSDDRVARIALDAWDAERCRLNLQWHGGKCEPMSEANKANILPMMRAALDAVMTAGVSVSNDARTSTTPEQKALAL